MENKNEDLHFAGNIFLELEELDKFEQCRDDVDNVDCAITNAGTFLTILCC